MHAFFRKIINCIVQLCQIDRNTCDSSLVVLFVSSFCEADLADSSDISIFSVTNVNIWVTPSVYPACTFVNSLFFLCFHLFLCI
jgi:hypothetical protein